MRTIAIPACLGRLSKEAVARHGGDDDVEIVLGRAAVGRGIGERADELHLFDNRVRPAVMTTGSALGCLARRGAKARGFTSTTKILTRYSGFRSVGFRVVNP